jgi:hypothetical protein
MILDDVWERWIPEPNTGCYLWLGALKGDGGGTDRKIPSIRDPKHGKYASPSSAVKVICDDAKGPLPKGLTRSHRCDNKMCVNPDHIVYEGQYENWQRTSPHRKSSIVSKTNKTRWAKWNCSKRNENI